MTFRWLSACSTQALVVGCFRVLMTGSVEENTVFIKSLAFEQKKLWRLDRYGITLRQLSSGTILKL
jgi:hypothetical protein